jgi:hypothetical protein
MYVDKYKKEVYGIRFHCPCWNLQWYEFGCQIPYKTKEKQSPLEKNTKNKCTE